MKATDEFQDMSVKQLREQATLRGISATGSKKELLERLSEDSDDIPLGGGMSFQTLIGCQYNIVGEG